VEINHLPDLFGFIWLGVTKIPHRQFLFGWTEILITRKFYLCACI